MLNELKRVAKGIAATFGSSCEVVIHDVTGKGTDSTIVAIENGHVTGRKVGDGASQVALEQHISALLMVEGAVRELTDAHNDTGTSEPQKIVNVNDLLDELITQSVQLVGKPVALMNKEDKMKAIGFLSQSGAFLVTKSGDKIAKYFGISKYTLYSYIDKQEGK